MLELTVEQFRQVLPNICDERTSSDIAGYNSENYLWGHCAVVSLLAQNLFGGELLRGSLTEVPGFTHMRSHYWNRLTDGTEIDFTKSQFGNNYPRLIAEKRDRSYVLSHPDTVKRYKELAFRLARWVGGCGPIFDSNIYRKCFDAAMDSPCQKMKFGCVITHWEKVVYEGCNATIGPLKTMCEPMCIRFGITSRTESMIGACGHAEEGMWSVIHQGIPIKECALYVAGFYPNGLPWMKEKVEHTCLRCATQMYNARLKRLCVPVVDRWMEMLPEEALITAKAYATQEKKI
jgi:deoxycytidylate deaminase